MTSAQITTESSTAAKAARNQMIQRYCDSVRACLSDLDPRVVADLTDGMPGDLYDSLIERGVSPHIYPADIFGSPAKYANELRAAAGIPIVEITSTTSKKQKGRAARKAAKKREYQTVYASDAATENPPNRRERARNWWQNSSAPVTDTPTWEKFIGWCRELAPFWWVARGWIIGSFIATWLTGWGISLLPANTAGWIFTLALTLLSIQWGRGVWLHWHWVPKLVMALSVIALVLAIPQYVQTRNRLHVWSPNVSNSWSQGWQAGFQAGQDSLNNNGILVNGRQINNIFAFDAEGNPVPLVQLFDENGLPIRFPSEELAEGWFTDWPVPNLAIDGTPQWNAFPIKFIPEQDIDWAETSLDPENIVVFPNRPAPAANWPFLKAANTFPLAPTAELVPDESADDYPDIVSPDPDDSNEE